MSEALLLTRRRLVAATALLALPGRASDLPPSEMVARADALRQPMKEGVLVFHAATYRENEPTVEATHEVRVKGRERSHVLATAGRDKGQRVLMSGENLWVRLPGSSRALRITPMQRLMGDVSYGDLGRLSWADDYEAEPHPEPAERQVDGLPATVLRLTARQASATYPRIDLWLAQAGGRPLQARFYLGSGKLLKTASFAAPETVQGRPVVREVVYRDALRPKAYTVLRLQHFKPEALADTWFNPQRFGE